MTTLWGWSPGLRLVNSTTLTCGCLVGVYARDTDGLVAVLDAKGTGCPHGGHLPNVVLELPAAPSAD